MHASKRKHASLTEKHSRVEGAKSPLKQIIQFEQFLTSLCGDGGFPTQENWTLSVKLRGKARMSRLG